MNLYDTLATLEINRPQLARMLGIGNQAIQSWVTNHGGKIPLPRACQIQVITGGRVKVDLSQYEPIPVEWACYLQVVSKGKFRADLKQYD